MEFYNQSNTMTYKDAFEFKKATPEDNSIMLENMINLDNTIVDAKNKKDTLNSTKDKIRFLFKEVEHREKIADDAVDKARRTSPYILAMMEEIKQAKQRTKEANEKRAQEVYAQKIFLATAMKELQYRVSIVLNEEVASLGDLDKMSILLDKRLTSALELKKATDKEEFEKIMALENEKRQMRKIEEESKRLEQEAMGNLKMREFIISRGHVVDMIQANITCRCRYVNHLKAESIYCKDEKKKLNTEKSLRELKHREKVGRTRDMGAKMNDPKHTHQRAKVTEEVVIEPDSGRWDFLSTMDIPIYTQNCAEEAVKKVNRTNFDVFSMIDEPKYAQKREVVDQAGIQKRVDRKDDTHEEEEETILGWDEKKQIPNLLVLRSRKSCTKDNRRIKKSEAGEKNKNMKKWIDGQIKEAVAEYEDDFARYERLYGF